MRQDITHYHIMAGNTNETIPATTACPSVNCFHRLLMTLAMLSDMITADVAAENVFGSGQRCVVGTPIGIIIIQFFTLNETRCFLPFRITES